MFLSDAELQNFAVAYKGFKEESCAKIKIRETSVSCGNLKFRT